MFGLMLGLPCSPLSRWFSSRRRWISSACSCTLADRFSTRFISVMNTWRRPSSSMLLGSKFSNMPPVYIGRQFLPHTRLPRIIEMILIRYLCHIEGAVHIDNPTTEEEEMLKAISENITVGGGSPVLRSICAISRVILKGLEPLKQAIITDTQEGH